MSNFFLIVLCLSITSLHASGAEVGKSATSTQNQVQDLAKCDRPEVSFGSKLCVSDGTSMKLGPLNLKLPKGWFYNMNFSSDDNVYQSYASVFKPTGIPGGSLKTGNGAFIIFYKTSHDPTELPDLSPELEKKSKVEIYTESGFQVKVASSEDQGQEQKQIFAYRQKSERLYIQINFGLHRSEELKRAYKDILSSLLNTKQVN